MNDLDKMKSRGEPFVYVGLRTFKGIFDKK